MANYFNLDTSTEITKRNILEKDSIYVAPGIAAECLQQNEQGHSMKKNTASQIRPLFVDLKHLMMQSHVTKKFERNAYHDQHLNGHFGKKLKTYCGKVYNWPNSCKYHQDKCDQCKTMRDATPYKYKPDG